MLIFDTALVILSVQKQSFLPSRSYNRALRSSVVSTRPDGSQLNSFFEFNVDTALAILSSIKQSSLPPLVTIIKALKAASIFILVHGYDLLVDPAILNSETLDHLFNNDNAYRSKPNLIQ